MTAVLGALLARWQSLRTLRQIQLSLSQGQIPAEELIDGVLILSAAFCSSCPACLAIYSRWFCCFPLRGHTSNAGCGADSTAWSRAGMSGSNITEAASAFISSRRRGVGGPVKSPFRASWRYWRDPESRNVRGAWHAIFLDTGFHRYDDSLARINAQTLVAVHQNRAARRTYRYASSGILNSAPSFANCSRNILRM